MPDAVKDCYLFELLHKFQNEKGQYNICIVFFSELE